MKGTNKDGKGKMTWSDGSTYEGTWKNDAADGKGVMVHSTGEVYDGDWLKGKCHG
eukprot:CAMPEP_0176338720 /NCGR_PEP_ID=MMETSP0126-20121128/177_1 /TAXON_ID=141414 ORGANISM="Strombidinopsis acuminatum, Strain SPMC142" /NCGR_SAMPLE_ID=MMETSP0126 /ASSEMBLY_ACC=CAM_ASM_000229 /LENGTH=54 /DNA_ID=CAMNT_0017681853 /DNA_START=509 /DNA_END=673 /DNA_ORIENTATION=-